MNRKLLIRLVCVFIIVLAVSSIAIYYTIDIENINHMSLFVPKYVLLAFISLAIGLFLDGSRLVHLVHVVGERTTLYDTIKVVFSNYFLALLTPGATGGAVAQVMFLKRAGVPAGKATVVVLVRTMLSILFLILVLPLVMSMDNMVIGLVSFQTLALIALLSFIIFVCLLVLLQTNYPEKWLMFFMRNTNRILKRRIYRFYKDIKITAQIFIKNPVVVVRVFFESGASLLFIYATVPILFYGINPDVHLGQALCRMIVLNLILYFTPTPGGVGVAEAGFVVLFNNMLPRGTVGIMAIAWRFIVEYVPFTIGGFFCIKTFGADIVTALSNKSKKDRDSLPVDKEYFNTEL